MLNKIRDKFNSLKERVTILPLALLAIAAIIWAVSFNNAGIAKPEKSIVAVLNKAQSGGGTGFAVKTLKGETVIVTNEHVCKVAENGLVRIKTDTGKLYLRRVLKEDATRDLCIVEGINIPTLTIAQNSPRRFEEITVLGHPYLTPTVYSKGQYSHDEIAQVGSIMPESGCPAGSTEQNALFFSICIREMEESVTTVVIYPGNSGSPVLNNDGHVVGVINIADSRMNRGAFVPLEYLLQILYGL